MKKSKRNRGAWLIALLAAFLVVYIGFYSWILHSVKETVTSIYMDGKNGIETDESRVSERVKSKFLQFIDFPNREADDDIYFKLSTGHVFHTFTRGTVWLQYTYEGGNYGASRVPIKIKVKLDHWKWIIVDKDERP
jgi:hypothetical protein